MTSKQHSGGPTRQISSDRSVTGPSCRALRTAVSELYSVDDFTKEKIAYGFFSEVYKVSVLFKFLFSYFFFFLLLD